MSNILKLRNKKKWQKKMPKNQVMQKFERKTLFISRNWKASFWIKYGNEEAELLFMQLSRGGKKSIFFFSVVWIPVRGTYLVICLYNTLFISRHFTKIVITKNKMSSKVVSASVKRTSKFKWMITSKTYHPETLMCTTNREESEENW